MKVPLSWLKEYVDVAVPAEELARRLTMSGTEVAEVVTIGEWKDCYVGYVTKVEPHPNADRLTLCTVDINGHSMKVVCGAPNVAEKQRVAFAKVGAELFNTHSGKVEPLKAATIRGVVSEGMICSKLELGIGNDHAGILVLPDDAPLGVPLADYLGDQVLDMDVTPNRPDCLSILGVAHEVAALTGATVREPEASYPETGEPIESRVSVEIADPDLCLRYTSSLITGITIEPSPHWIQERLLKTGMRPINNVVDITNYVMLEYNQPLHAFDFDTLKDGRIVVRRARPGEVMVSLDGATRKLSPEMLVIADAEDAIALGGVMGAAHTEMTERTTTVLLESATFNPVNNRRTAQALRLSSEATNRFEKGLRTELAPIALRRATQLIHEIAGGVVATGILDVFPASDRYLTPTLTLSMERLHKVLGVSLPIKRVEMVLVSLGLACEKQGKSALLVTVPYWRSDINIEDDLVEEVARIAGYEEIPTTMLSTPIPHHQPQPLRELKERVKDLLAGLGMQEVITYPVTSLEELGKVNALDSGVTPVKLLNPMSSQQECLRTTLQASVLSTLSSNLLHETGPVAIFESGRIYLPNQDALPREREVVSGALSGPRQETHWLGGAGEMGFYDAKGVVESLLRDLEVSATFEPAQDSILHPGKSSRIAVGSTQVGILGEVRPDVVEAFEMETTPVALFELDLESLLGVLPENPRRYRSLGRFPRATRDVAIIVDSVVPAGKILNIISSQRLVVEALLFDVYAGDKVPAGKHSLAYHVHFQSPDKTLEAEEVGRALKAVVQALEREVGAQLRG